MAPVLKVTRVLTKRTDLERAVGRRRDIRVVDDPGEEKWIHDSASFCVGVAWLHRRARVSHQLQRVGPGHPVLMF